MADTGQTPYDRQMPFWTIKTTHGGTTMKPWLMSGLLLVSTLLLSGCTTCDVALWLGNDVCEIGGY